MRSAITLQNLVGISLDSIAVDYAMISRLMKAAQSSLQDAKLNTISNESRFDLAYKAIMQMANAALQAKGYRVLTSKPGHHQLILQAFPLTIGLDKTQLILLDQLCRQRNAIEYSGDIVSDVLTAEVIAQAETLLKLVQANLRLEDDAPELTTEDVKRGVWSIDEKVVSEAEGRAAFAKKFKAHSQKQ